MALGATRGLGAVFAVEEAGYEYCTEGFASVDERHHIELPSKHDSVAVRLLPSVKLLALWFASASLGGVCHMIRTRYAPSDGPALASDDTVLFADDDLRVLRDGEDYQWECYSWSPTDLQKLQALDGNPGAVEEVCKLPRGDNRTYRFTMGLSQSIGSFPGCSGNCWCCRTRHPTHDDIAPGATIVNKPLASVSQAIAEEKIDNIQERPWECHHYDEADFDLLNSRAQNDVCERPRADGYEYTFAFGAGNMSLCAGCTCCRRWADPDEPIPANRFGFVTMAFVAQGAISDVMWGALALARALTIHSDYPLVLLTNTTSFPDGTSVKKAFGALRTRILPISLIQIPGSQGWHFERWKFAFWKLQIWRLTQFERLIWLDSDAMVFRSLDWLFFRNGMWAQRDDWFCKLENEAVCSGIVLFYPKLADFYGMLTYAGKIGPQLTGGDQQVIDWYFRREKQQSIYILSPLEAAFGQCAGSIPPVLYDQQGAPFEGLWSVPAFVHKSGGWHNTVYNDYSSVCFTQDLARQRYVVDGKVFNVCHFSPLAAAWRYQFCSAIVATGIHMPSSTEFCNDICYFRGYGHADCMDSGMITGGPLTPDLGEDEFNAPHVGLPAPEALKSPFFGGDQSLNINLGPRPPSGHSWHTPLSLGYARSSGAIGQSIVYTGFSMPAKSFTLAFRIRTDFGRAQTVMYWPTERGGSLGLFLVQDTLAYAEQLEWQQPLRIVRSMRAGFSSQVWNHVGVSRHVDGHTSLFVNGVLVGAGNMPAIIPPGFLPNPTSSVREQMTLSGEIKDLVLYFFQVEDGAFPTLAKIYTEQ
mmetsp:Transcript_68712/g.192672  ORF Transcript_68712/g.192672 Transcript_68712/m.192672 type:complete len:811 (+) Transcript_68712:3-2435(+)